MFKDALEIEENLMAWGKLKNRVEANRRRQENQPSTSAPSSTNYAKFDIIMKTMGRLMDRMDPYNRPPNREKPENQARNPNSRKPPPPTRN